MKVCPKCKQQHEKPGMFCSRSCANSRQWGDQDKKKKSESAKRSWENPTEAMKIGTQKKIELLRKGNKKRGYKYQEEVFEQYTRTGDTQGLSKMWIKRIVLEEQDTKCIICGTGNIWNGKLLTFQLDHINGDSSNNSRSNVRLLCPNCHTQQPTSFVNKTTLKKRLDSK